MTAAVPAASMTGANIPLTLRLQKCAGSLSRHRETASHTRAAPLTHAAHVCTVMSVSGTPPRPKLVHRAGPHRSYKAQPTRGNNLSKS